MISIVIPHANRFNNLFKCLDSLILLNPPASQVIVSDFSTSIPSEEIKKRYSGKLVLDFVHYNSKGKGFDRSKAINWGRKHINNKSKIILILDADLIIPPQSMKILLDTFKKGKELKSLLVGFPGMMMNKKGNLSKNVATFRQVYGAFSACLIKDFDRCGGYNPLMRGWGYRDNDFRERMLKMGVQERILTTKYKHMWHPSSVNAATDRKNREISVKTCYKNGRWLYIK